MSSLATSTYSLANETGLSAEICKIALERANQNIENAKQLLELWTSKKSDSINTKGIICSYVDREFESGAIVNIKCTDPAFIHSKDFYNLASNITNDIVQYEQYYAQEYLIDKLEKELTCKFDISYVRYEKSSISSLLTTYTHKNKIAAIVETEVANEQAYNSKLFRIFSFDCAMHIAAFNPISIGKDDVPPAILDNLSTVIEKELMQSGRAMNMWPHIIEGKKTRWIERHSLLNQIFIKSDKQSVNEVKQSISEKINSEIIIKRFARFGE